MAGLLLVLFGIALIYILPLLTAPPGLAKEYIQRAPNLNASFVLALEYESFSIRTAGGR